MAAITGLARRGVLAGPGRLSPSEETSAHTNGAEEMTRSKESTESTFRRNVSGLALVDGEDIRGVGYREKESPRWHRGLGFQV
jgi:hypothetical protein